MGEPRGGMVTIGMVSALKDGCPWAPQSVAPNTQRGGHHQERGERFGKWAQRVIMQITQTLKEEEGKHEVKEMILNPLRRNFSLRIAWVFGVKRLRIPEGWDQHTSWWNKFPGFSFCDYHWTSYLPHRKLQDSGLLSWGNWRKPQEAYPRHL